MKKPTFSHERIMAHRAARKALGLAQVYNLNMPSCLRLDVGYLSAIDSWWLKNQTARELAATPLRGIPLEINYLKKTNCMDRCPWAYPYTGCPAACQRCLRVSLENKGDGTKAYSAWAS